MNPVERAYLILDLVMRRGPMSFQDLRWDVPVSGFILAGDLVTLGRIGALKIDPPLFQPCEDPPPPMQIEVGTRLRAALLAARVRE